MISFFNLDHVFTFITSIHFFPPVFTYLVWIHTKITNQLINKCCALCILTQPTAMIGHVTSVNIDQIRPNMMPGLFSMPA